MMYSTFPRPFGAINATQTPKPVRNRTALFSHAKTLICGLTVCLAAASGDSVSADTLTLTGNGLKHTRSAYSVDETVARIKADVEAKGIRFFDIIDQGALGVDAGIALPPSKLVIFGNPPLGLLFLTAEPDSGMDWPVRMLVREDKDGKVYAVYQNWDWVAQRYGITNRTAEFAKATMVVESILSAVADCNPVADCTQ